MTWEKFLDKVSNPIVTPETYSQYLSMTKDQQLAVKDVGGYVGGVIRGGRRLINSVTARYIVTLDLDFADMDFLDDVRNYYGNALVITSTHKHSSLTPRFRLLMPLSREVMSDEYEAVARKIAGNLNIELFDPTTFQPERLMFHSSVAKDGEWVYVKQDGPWIDPDEVLAEYEDWRDVSQWPMSSKAKAKMKAGVGRQEDPTTKQSQVGVFCRSYGVTEAIEKFIPDIYIKTDHDDRYTYAMGSTSAGVIVYDDLFSFSHHSTDPVQGRLCNAFDLVRLQLYGHLDDSIDEKVPQNKRPSFLKMLEVVAKDGKCRKTGLTEQLRGIEGDFAVNETADLDWTEKLEVDKKGNVLNTIANFVIILNYDENLKNALSFDDFEKIPVLQRSLPWRKINQYDRYLTDTDESNFRNYMENVYKVMSPSKLADAIDIVIHQNTFHPIRDYVRGLVWDGVERLDTMLVDYLGAEDTVYVRSVTRKTFVAAVARVFNPGCKFDYALTLVGPQGIGKSRLIGLMGRQWFSDTFGNLNTNQAMENIQGAWIMEMGELAGLNKHDVETIKLFIAKQTDRYRVAYGKRVDTFPRQTIFIGTSNNKTPLKDTTGGRRFWIVNVEGSLLRDVSEVDVDQMWAEAWMRYSEGEKLYLDDEIECMAREIQAEHTENDDRMTAIITYLEKKVPAKWYEMTNYERVSYLGDPDEVLFGEPEFVRDKITLPEIWTECFRGMEKDMSGFNTKFIRTIMNNMDGWKSKLINLKPYGTQRGWVKSMVKI